MNSIGLTLYVFSDLQFYLMSVNRREFLLKSGAFASAFALSPWAATSKLDSSAISNGSIARFGLQLYTLRDDLPKDPKGILKQVANFGYKQIEGYEGASGLWWGLGAREFKKYIDGLGLSMVSSHCDTEKDFDKKCEEAASVGLKYLLSPWGIISINLEKPVKNTAFALVITTTIIVSSHWMVKYHRISS